MIIVNKTSKTTSLVINLSFISSLMAFIFVKLERVTTINMPKQYALVFIEIMRRYAWVIPV